ncbi:MAG: hypothetical protein IPP73_10255 [Chitinophagaceae bacterium]|nr:hypothetical protein [Chitinophagaceae bacterium]
MQNILKICSIVSIIIAAIKLAMIGNLTPGMVTFIILSSIIIIAGNRTVYIITAAVAAFDSFQKVYGGDAARQSALLQSIMTLAIVCFGFYIIFSGVFGNNRNRRYR